MPIIRARYAPIFSRVKRIGMYLRTYWRVVLYPLGLLPAAWLLWLGVEGKLGADPVNTFERALGLWAFRFLLLCLLVAPLHAKTRINFLRYRRLLGLLAFFYACFHMVAYIGLDAGFNLSILLKDVTHRTFIILGMIAFSALLPLALTSNRWSMRLLKRWWKRLHLLIFPASLCVAVHFFLSFKTLTDLSAFYDAILICLLAVRIPKWGRDMKRSSIVRRFTH